MCIEILALGVTIDANIGIQTDDFTAPRAVDPR